MYPGPRLFTPYRGGLFFYGLQKSFLLPVRHDLPRQGALVGVFVFGWVWRIHVIFHTCTGGTLGVNGIKLGNEE